MPDTNEIKNNIKTSFVVKKAFFENKQRDGNFMLSPEVAVSIRKLNNDIWETMLSYRVLDKEEQPFPFNLEVSIALISDLSSTGFDKEQLIQYLKVNSVNILFPYLRSAITNITSAALVNPIVIPIVDTSALASKIVINDLENDQNQ